MEIPNKSKGEHYNLRWNSYTNNLVQVLLEHQIHENLVDVTLCCEGQFIKAHKLVLSACSKVFQDMFKVHSNVQHPVIILNGIKYKHFKHILEFIYQGEVKVLDVDLEGVLTLGESLQVKGLSSIKLKHQVSSEEMKATALKHTANVAESMQNALPNSNVPSNSFLNSVNNSQPKPKDLKYNDEQKRIEQNSQLKKSCPDEVNRSTVKKVQMNTDSNRNISKLESILTDPNETAKRKRFKSSEVHQSSKNKSIESVENESIESISEAEKNFRPANAFMIFANEWRKKLAVEHPDENNKAISVKLGNMWKSLSYETKESYYLAARKMESEQMEKQPELSTSKKKKMSRRKTVDSISHLVSVNLQEFDDDDDLQIIEISNTSTMVSHTPAKKNHLKRNGNT